jgi:hypothetical protein
MSPEYFLEHSVFFSHPNISGKFLRHANTNINKGTNKNPSKCKLIKDRKYLASILFVDPEETKKGLIKID